jgi:hypothetical protein
MNDFQNYALAHPLAQADGYVQQSFRRVNFPWSIILTVNK